jgi:hypothetical protein
MRLTVYQLITPIVSCVAMSYAWNLVFRKRKTILEALLWTLFWGVVAGIALFPQLLTYLSIATGIANQVNAVIVTFLGLLFFIVFSLVVRLEELEQRQARLAREIALARAGIESHITQ